MKQLACGHFDVRIEDYAEDYRWVVRCGRCDSRERWTRGEWRERLLLDESAEGPPLRVDAEAEPESARLAPV